MTDELRYEEPPDATVEEVRAAMAAGVESAEISRMLVGLTFHEPDWRSVQDLCLEILDGPDRSLAATAVTCLGHVARLHKQIDRARVIPAIRALQDVPLMKGRVITALDDIERFAPPA